VGLSRTRTSRALIVVTCVAAALAAAQAWRVQRDDALNRAIAATPNNTSQADEPDARPELRFARAHALAGSGAADAALNAYAALHGDSALGRAARYNSANLLLRQAIAQQAREQAGQTLALIELAKEHYREVLRHDPHDWDARYNLERAQRLLPDPDGDDEAPPALRRDAERAATTMRGHSPGLP
jgi:mxaK protein